MPLEGQTQTLNRVFKEKSAQDVVAHGISMLGRAALVSSFGADSVVLLHMAAAVDRDVPVLFLDTELLFPETLAYQRQVAQVLGLSNVQVLSTARDVLFTRDNENLLHLHDPDACCSLRKTEPLEAALNGYHTWISGRKRHQGGARAQIELFEVDRGDARLPRIKVNPLAHWSAREVADYISAHNLPRHPLVAKGYPSVGCAPCTTRVNSGEDTRAGRWRNQPKTECGLHNRSGQRA